MQTRSLHGEACATVHDQPAWSCCRSCYSYPLAFACGPAAFQPPAAEQFYELCHRRSADFDTVRQIKERLCFMAFDLEQEIQVRTWRDGPLTYRCGSCSSSQTERHLAQHGIKCALCMLCSLCPAAGAGHHLHH